MVYIKYTTNSKDTRGLKKKGGQEINQANTNQKKAGILILNNKNRLYIFF